MYAADVTSTFGGGGLEDKSQLRELGSIEGRVARRADRSYGTHALNIKRFKAEPEERRQAQRAGEEVDETMEPGKDREAEEKFQTSRDLRLLEPPRRQPDAENKRFVHRMPCHTANLFV